MSGGGQLEASKRIEAVTRFLDELSRLQQSPSIEVVWKGCDGVDLDGSFEQRQASSNLLRPHKVNANEASDRTWSGCSSIARRQAISIGRQRRSRNAAKASTCSASADSP